MVSTRKIIEAFKAVDKNGNFQLENDELNGFVTSDQLTRLDTNKDGVVDLAEWFKYKGDEDKSLAVARVFSSNILEETRNPFERAGVKDQYDRLTFILSWERFIPEDKSLDKLKDYCANYGLFAGAMSVAGFGDSDILNIALDHTNIFWKAIDRKALASFVEQLDKLGPIDATKKKELIKECVTEYFLPYMGGFLKDLRSLNLSNDEVLSVFDYVLHNRQKEVMRFFRKGLSAIRKFATDQEIKDFILRSCHDKTNGLKVICPDLDKVISFLRKKGENKAGIKSIVFEYLPRATFPYDYFNKLETIYNEAQNLEFAGAKGVDRFKYVLDRLTSSDSNGFDIKGLSGSRWFNSLNMTDDDKRNLFELALSCRTPLTDLKEVFDAYKKIGFNDARTYKLIRDARDKNPFGFMMHIVENIAVAVDVLGVKDSLEGEVMDAAEKHLWVSPYHAEFFKELFPSLSDREEVARALGRGGLMQFMEFLGNSKNEILKRKMTAGEVLELCKRAKKELGVSFFGRYSVKIFDAVLNDKGGDKTAFVVTPSADWNGAFYNMREDIGKLINSGYHIVMVEAKDEDDIYSKMDKVPDGSINVLLIGGHGWKEGTRLSEDGGEERIIDPSDIEWTQRAGKMAEGAVVILESCSTGQGGAEDASNMVSSFKRWFNSVKGIRVYGTPVDAASRIIISPETGMPAPLYDFGNVEPVMSVTGM